MDRCLSVISNDISDEAHVLRLVQGMAYHLIDTSVQEYTYKYFAGVVADLPPRWNTALTETEIAEADSWIECAGLDNQRISALLNSVHWLMDLKPRKELQAVLKKYPPGRMLKDRSGHYWTRRTCMAVTRQTFLSPVGDSQERFYEQKYLLTLPLTNEDSIVHNSLSSWLELCVSDNL